MTLIGKAANITNSLQAGASALSLISAGKALLTPNPKPGITPADAKANSFLGNLQLQFLSGTPVSFLFDIPKSEELTLSAQITDHYVEDNYAIQDHMAHEPIRINLTGDIAELVYKKSDIEKFLDQVLDRLSALPWISPENSLAVRNTLSTASRLKSAIDVSITQAKNAYNSVFGTGQPAKTLQQQAYGMLYNFWKNRIVVSVETPWETFPSMLIETITFQQDETTADLSTVTITVKEFKTASVFTGLGTLKGRIAAQASDPVDKGSSPGKSVLKTITDSGADAAKAIGDYFSK
jgi:hypothetical protein